AAEAAALRAGRPALAGWVRLAGGAPEAQAKVRWAAALAQETNASGGRLSSAYVEMVRGLDAAALDDDSAGRLLAWASAIRAGIVRPSPESAELLRRHAPVVAAHRGLAALGDSFLRAANRGDYLVPGVSNELRDTQRAEEQRRLRSAQSRQLLAEGPRKKIKYQLATEVWKHLLQDDGEVGRLLALAAADAEDRAGRAGADVERLRAAGAVERLIDDTTADLRGGRSKRRIEAAARRRLGELVDEALDIVHDWSRAAREVLVIRDAKPEHLGMQQRLAQLRGEAFEVRDDCVAELAELERDAPDPVLGAAARTARILLEDTLRLLSGAPLGAEPRTPDQVTGQDLLLAPGIALRPGSFQPRGVPALSELLPLCDGGAPDWTAAFDARAQRDDHVGTEAIVRALRPVDPDLAAALERRRGTLKEQARREMGELREKVGDKLAQMRRDGQLDESAATRLQTRLRPLNDPDRDDFDRLRAVAESVAAEADEIAARQVAGVRADLEAHLGEPSVAAAADRIREYLDRGDLTTARESLVQARQGRELPEPSRERGHLARFFPAFPDAFEALGSSRRNEQVSTAINTLIDAMEHGGRLDDDRLRRLLSGAGLDLTALRRPGVSREGLRKWRTVAQGPKAAGNLLTAIEPVLRMIGLEAAARPGAAERARTWIELTGVHWRGPALLPQFGTGMSPSGDTLRLLLVWQRPRPQEIVEWFKGEPADQTVLVWYFGTLSAADRRRLVRAARRRPHPVAVLDDAAIGYLACLPECDWTDTVEVLAPFTSFNPFIPTGNVPEEMFYGRQEQLRQVIDRKGGSFVYGGRQLGKSALLHAARRQVDRDPNRIVIFKSISAVGRTDPADAVWARLRRPLADVGVLSPAHTGGDAEEIREAIRAWLAGDPQRQLLILLDEADEFLNRDADSARFANVSALRDLMSETDRRVKVVFAGLHQTARFKSLPNQPLAHFGEPISIGPLQPQDAFDLLTKPLATLGFRLPETLAARVIAEANNAPALIQLFADALLKHLQRQTADEHPLPYEVTRADVDAVREDARLAEGFRERFDWTINLDQRYKVIAYVVAFRALTEAADATAPAGDLFGECRQWWPQGFAQCTRDEFQGLLDESVELGILLAEDGRYRLRTPYILDLLGGEEQVQESLDQAEEFELPDSFDVHSYRSVYPSGPERWERSPLTSGQVSRLLRRANLVHVLAGSAALRLEHVPNALRAEEDHNPHVKVHVLQKGGTFDALVAKSRTHRGHTLIVMDLRERTAEQAAAQIREACETVTRHHSSHEGTLGVVFTAPPALAPLWLAARTGGESSLAPGGNAELMELRRFDPPSIRQWMREEAHAFQTPHSQQNLLAATGGWPMLISKVLDGGAVADPDAALDKCHRLLRDTPQALVSASGVHCRPPVQAAWQALVDIDEPGTPADLADLLAPGEEADHPLGPDALRRHHFRSIADVIEVLRILGALIPAPGNPHELVCEPVLAGATRGEQA
ncbi:ATP-binding protein, partial [Actinomadura miaoliensis]|uniref:ATP-binding protein n=1 Tax=Actinomadura miaoliensis TaxID=430685 RepID=UPI0031E8ED28